MSGPLILALDQGTTSTRAMLFDANLKLLSSAQAELKQDFPHPGWVEQQAEPLWQSCVETIRQALAAAGAAAGDVAALGLTNQRETLLVWERDSGQAVCPAIVWQDRRTEDICERLRADGVEKMVSQRTGLLLDPYFSATKLGWILDRDPLLRRRAEAGELAAGTVDSYIIWRLTGGAVHRTDATNASRTLLYDIHRGQWDSDLLDLFGIPAPLLPQVADNAADFGSTDAGLFDGSMRIGGAIGDQQSAAVGQACLQPGMLKCTYGTGCFALLNTGRRAVPSNHRLLTTVALQIGGERTYALEGAIFVAGAAVQWLRDELQILPDAAHADAMAAAADPEQEVVMVPAFTGLGAPHWDSRALAAIRGLTRSSGRNELVRAALEAAAYQTRDLLEAMALDWQAAGVEGSAVSTLRVDGGMSSSDWTMQFLADMLDAPVDRPLNRESTALGAACVAGLEAGIWHSLADAAQKWQLDRRFEPTMGADERELKYAVWQRALEQTLSRPDRA